MAHSKNLEYFYTLLDQYKQIAFPDFIQEETSPLATIEQLGTVDHVKSISDQQVIDIVVSGCKCIGHQSTLSRPFYQFLYKQFTKQIRVTNFRSSQFDIVIHYMLDGLERQDEQLSDDCKVDLLRALSALVFETANNAQRSAGRLAKLLMTLANPSYKSLEVRRMAINCIGNLCVNGGSTKLQPFFQDLYACLLSNLCKVNRTSDGTIMVTAPTTDMLNDTAVRKIASSTLRAIQFLLSQDRSLVTNPLCDIIDIIHSFIFMHVNVPSYSVNQTGNTTRRNKILPSPPSQPAFPWRMTYQMKSMSLATSSESELSDSTTSVLPELSPRRQRDYAKIRINALLCLSAIASTSPKVLYSHWSKFLPDTFSIFLSNNTNSEGRLLPYLKSDNQPCSLFTILIYDPMVHVRSAVCNTLIAMLDGSKHYLSLALESDKHKSSFTSLSENLGSMIHDIHQGFIYSLDKEQTTQVLTLIMQAIVLLVENCSYERLSKSHLPSLYHAIKAHWKEPSLRSSVLKVVMSIFNTTHQENLEPLIQKDLIDNIILQAVKMDGEEQKEGWNTCMILTKNYYQETMPELWQKLVNEMEVLPLTTESLRLIEAYSISKEQEEKDTEWWTMILKDYLQKASIDEQASIRAAACDCFSSMPKETFEAFHYRYQRLIVTLLLSLVVDSDTNVKGAACRSLGIFILFPSLREDPMFVSDMTKAILSQKENKAIIVRVRASWAIANLCDALVLESEKPEFNLREYLSTTEWMEILSMATAGAVDNEKLRSNAVRAIGSLLRITPKEYFENTRIMSLIRNAVMQGLVKNIEGGSSLKIRWNACHATGNMLLNLDFPIGEGYPWTHPLYQALLKALVHCKNFKVRINACLALTASKDKARYGNQLPIIIEGILEAWNTCQLNQEYKEIRYKQQLEQQIISSLECLKEWIPAQFKDQVNGIIKVP